MLKPSRLLVKLAPLLLVACSGYDHGDYYINPPPTGPQANIQVLNASPDAPAIDVLIDGQAAIQGLDYGQGTGEQSLSAAAHTITVQAETPGAPTTVIGPTNLTLQTNMDYVIVAEGPIASIGPMIFTHALSVVASDSTRVQVLHAAPTAPSLAVYLTAPGVNLSSSTPFGTFAFQGSAGPTDIPAGQYELRITAAGTTTPVLFDSGTITLDGGADLVFTALQNTGPGTAPVILSVVDAFGDTGRIYDVNTPATLRVIHDSPDAPPLSLIANNNASAPLVPTLSYPGFTSYQSIAPGPLNIAITPASNPSDVLVSQQLDLDAGSVHSVYAIGKLASINTLVTRDYNRRYATQAKLRIIQGSLAAGTVDVYLTPPGAGIAIVNPTYAGVPFGADTGFVSYVAGSYDLTITAAGSKSPAIGPTTVSLSNSGIYTAVARDAPGGGFPLGLILLDDLP